MAFVQRFFEDMRTSLYKNAIYLMMNTGIATAVGLLFWIVVARYYSPYEVGLAAAIIPLMTLIGLLSTLGFGSGLIRFLPSSGEKSGEMINTSLTISSLTAVLVSVVFLMGLHIWSPALIFLRENWVFFLSFVMFSVVFSLYLVMSQIFVARRNTKFVLASTSIGGLRIPLPIVFVAFFGAFGIFVSWGLAMLVATVVGILLFLPMVNPGYRPFPTVSKEVVNDMFHFSAGNYVGAILGALPAAALPLLVLHSLPAENVAYFYIAFTMAGLLFAIPGAVCMSLFAEGSHFEEELGRNVRKALKLTFALLVPAMVIVFFLGGHLLLLFGVEYSSEGLILLQVFAFSSIFVALNNTFLATRRVLKRLKPIIAIPAFFAFSIIGLGYVFLEHWNLVGVAVAWTVGQAIVSVAIGLYLLGERRRWTLRKRST